MLQKSANYYHLKIPGLKLSKNYIVLVSNPQPFSIRNNTRNRPYDKPARGSGGPILIRFLSG